MSEEARVASCSSWKCLWRFPGRRRGVDAAHDDCRASSIMSHTSLMDETLLTGVVCIVIDMNVVDMQKRRKTRFKTLELTCASTRMQCRSVLGPLTLWGTLAEEPPQWAKNKTTNLTCWTHKAALRAKCDCSRFEDGFQTSSYGGPCNNKQDRLPNLCFALPKSPKVELMSTDEVVLEPSAGSSRLHLSRQDGSQQGCAELS